MRVRRDTWHRWGARDRSLTLLHVFLAASAAILLAGGSVLGLVLARSLRSQAIADRRDSLARYVDGVLRPQVVRSGRIVVDRTTARELLEAVRREPQIVSVKVWRPNGVLAWTNLDQSRIGKRFPLDGELGKVIRTDQAHGQINHLQSTGEDSFEKRSGVPDLLEVYAPIESARGGRPIGVYEIYADAAPLESFIASRRNVIWLTVAAVFLALYAALALLVRQASAALRRRTRELADSYRRLAESSLEAIETLNATVEAKDPYTAGHSQRVQVIAVLVGQELGLSGERLDALRLGALFHDIGKLAVPDAVLTKPGPLTGPEREQIEQHSTEGARIVGKLGRLRAAVPVIRHHHERWDGTGYPDGLAAEEIPLEAAVAGLADAWDAMTTERPYSRALTRDEALAQLCEGRGTQFAPAVVDAFLAGLRRRPDALEAAAPPPEPVPLSAAAG